MSPRKKTTGQMKKPTKPTDPTKYLFEWAATEDRVPRAWYWYVCVVVAALAIAFWFLVLTGYGGAVVILLAATSLIIANAQKARTWNYRFTNGEISVKGRPNAWQLEQFKSFYLDSFPSEGGVRWDFIVLMPKKRFGVEVTVYLPRNDSQLERQVVDIIQASVPRYQDEFGRKPKPDFVNWLAKKLRIG